MQWNYQPKGFQFDKDFFVHTQSGKEAEILESDAMEKVLMKVKNS